MRDKTKYKTLEGMPKESINQTSIFFICYALRLKEIKWKIPCKLNRQAKNSKA